MLRLRNKKKWYYIAALLAICVVGFSEKLSAQCNFNLTAVMKAESDCQSNGVILATLYGPDVDNGNIDLNDAKFGIESVVSGGYVQPPVANDGEITNVPPGTYEITVQAYCKKSNSWMVRTFSPVTVTGTYVVPNINNIKVLSGNIEKSLKCEATGSIPINLEGGKPPYTVTISSAPAGYSGPTAFTQPTEGVLTIANLPAGIYAFEVQDYCTYALYGIPPVTIDEIQPSYTVGAVTHTAACTEDGVIPITVKDGAAPYTVEMVGYPSGYAGQKSFTAFSDTTFTIKGLPNGSYTFKVKDKCYEETHTATINEIRFEASRGVVKGTTTCSEDGSVAISMNGGLAPYTVTVTSAPSCFTLSWSQTYFTGGTQTIGGLCEGTYTIEVKDACGTTKTFPDITIDAVHLSVSLSSKKPADASCTTTGEATIGITGGQKPYEIALVSTDSPYYSNPGTLPTNNSSYTIRNLSPGSYTFEVTDGCGEKKKVTFEIGYTPITAVARTVISSFECLATGQLIITVINGMPPFDVVMINHTETNPPPTYTGPTSGFQPTAPPDGRVFEIDGLPNGTYDFEITDACGDKDTVTGMVDSLPVDYPFDFYHNYFLHPDPKDSDCKKVVIRRNINATGTLGYYWNVNPGKYYEVAFAEDADILDNSYPAPLSLLDTLDWNPVTQGEDSTITLSRSYCNMRNDNGYVLVFLRVIDGTNGFLCGVSTDTVWMDEIKTTLSPPYNQSCDGYSVNYELSGLFCYPYRWELLDINSSDAVVKREAGISSPAQTVTNIPYGKHVFKFTDDEECYWYSDTLDYYWSPLPTVKYDVERDCGIYNLTFEINDVCPPYEWEFYSSIGTIKQGNVSAMSHTDTVTGLEFDKDYFLKITYNNGQKDTTIRINESATFFYGYKIGFEPSYCLPDTGKGAIFIYRDSAMPYFEKNSSIEFVSGPTTPLHTFIPIQEDDIRRVYPFSVDSLAHSFQDIMPGMYEFTLTDSCGVAHQLQLEYKTARLEGFGYTKDETCAGVKIFPEGTIYLGNEPQPTYFRISAAPHGIAIDTASVTATGTPNFLFLPESGQYEIQVSADRSPTSCPFDKFTIDYTKLSVSLDADSTEAYICEEGNSGFIKVVRKGGVGPFEYELFDQGVSIEKNTAGRFNYGVSGSTYTIRIKDEGCKVSFDQNIMLINLANERLIYGTTGYCPGDIIELNSLSVNNTSGYHWEGPNGFTSSAQHPRITNADSTHQGIYTLTIQPSGCNGAIRQTIETVSYKPEVPMADSVSIVCLNTQAAPLEATPSSPDNVLKWYDTNGTSPLSSAPVPSTVRVDTITYYVSQVNTIWGCEGDKIPVTAAISDLPSIDITAQAPVICPGMIPTIAIPETYAGYTYSLYDAKSGGILLGTEYSLGDMVKINSRTPITDSKNFYVEVIDENACVSPERKAVTALTENYLEIKPDILPEYQRGKPYSVQLRSNAVEPYAYSSNYGLPIGFNLSTLGLITGTAPGNGYIEPKSFDVELKDANGCVATKLYMLESEPFIPNTFTPNEDGYNDIFMKGHHLIIFDRLGVVIYEGNDGWDGRRNNGKKAPPDTYFYILDYQHKDATISQKKGYITVLKRE